MSRPGSEISYDYLHLSDKVSKITGSNGTKEEVMFSEHVIKINRKGARQKRVLVITNKALYNINRGVFFDKLSCSKGPMQLLKIKKISLCTKTSQSIIHVVDGYYGYDYHYFSDKCEEVSKLLTTLFGELCSHRKDLKVEKLQQEDLDTVR